MKQLLWVATLFFKIGLYIGASFSFALTSLPQEGPLTPPGDFILEEVSQKSTASYLFCSHRGLLEPRGWLRREIHSLRPGAPRPSVVELRRHLKAAVQSLGGQVTFEGRCVELDSLGDPRASHVILTGILPTPWGQLHVEIWPWEEGQELHCAITFLLEQP